MHTARANSLNRSPFTPDTILLLGYVFPHPYAIPSAHLRRLQDVDWHSSEENVFASVGDDKKLML